ncbi:MAG: hypothetical protein VKJ24_10650 [Synechococcales bacterium]|nr:hypothetical protein [Synechococcales bacterium]
MPKSLFQSTKGFTLTPCLLAIALLMTSGMPMAEANRNQPKPFSWDSVLKVFQKGPRQGGTRDALCIIAPLNGMPGQVSEVWNSRPTLVWRGNLTQLELVELQGKTEQSLGRFPMQGSKNWNQFTYNGKPLEPGKRYAWLLFDSGKMRKFPIARIRFRLSDPATQKAITDGLKQLRAADRETLLYERVNFLTEKGFHSDAIAEMVTVSHPTPERIKAIQDLRILCQDQITSAPTPTTARP